VLTLAAGGGTGLGMGGGAGAAGGRGGGTGGMPPRGGGGMGVVLMRGYLQDGLMFFTVPKLDRDVIRRR
jgi:hypothetical protein